MQCCTILGEDAYMYPNLMLIYDRRTWLAKGEMFGDCTTSSNIACMSGQNEVSCIFQFARRAQPEHCRSEGGVLFWCDHPPDLILSENLLQSFIVNLQKVLLLYLSKTLSN